MKIDLIPQKRAIIRGAVFLIAALVLAGCKRGGQQGYQMPPPQIGIITLEPQALAMTNEFPGRIDPMQIAQINARVDGVVLHRKFEQGADVKAGQVLYEIDPAPYQAALDSAKASWAQAQQLADRYKPLVGINAVSKQNYENAVATAAQDKAAEEIAAINLGYCTVTAPISGRIGQALVTEGALVSQSAATEMAVIQQMDPVYFDFTESSAEALKLQEALKAGELTNASPEAAVTLTLPDGSDYPQVGKLLFSDVTVNPSSGMITLRAEFPNPDGLLLPGMFAVGRVAQAIAPQALLVPQPAVNMNPDGSASVLLVTPANQLAPQADQIGEAVGGDWIITQGLKPGDQVMVDGFQKAQPGMTVSPVPVTGTGGTPLSTASSTAGK